MLYRCKIVVDDTIMYDRTLKSLRLIAEDLGLPYSRIADIHSRQKEKKTKFKYEPKILIEKINKELPPQDEEII